MVRFIFAFSRSPPRIGPIIRVIALTAFSFPRFLQDSNARCILRIKDKCKEKSVAKRTYFV